MFTAFAVGLCLSANVMAQVPSYVPTNGLVGWWPFNGNANDESGNGNNGTVNGATLTTDRNGVANKAYSFDGVSNRIEIEHNSNLNLSSISISCWINPSALLTTTGYGPTILSKREASGWGASCQMNIGNHAFWADWTISSNSGIYHTDNTNLLININTIAHFVYTHDASKVRLYLNGTLVEEINSPGLLSYNTLPLWFGARPLAGGNSSYFNGVIDDIGIWNRSLNQQEITNLYNGCSASTITSQPSNSSVNIGSSAQFSVGSTIGGSYQWQSNPLNTGWLNLTNNSTYSGVTSNTLNVSNTTISNHDQPFRAIVNASGCLDTSDVAQIIIGDTCLTTVTDTLIINTTLGLPAPNNENTILIYPNPASDHITIDNGNYTAMVGYTIKIENNAGQQVFQSLINQAQFYVDLSTWSGNGLYFVHLIDAQGNTVTVRKIVLQ